MAASIPEILDELARQARERRGIERAPARPHLLLNMASTADGRASLGGRAGAIGDRADSELLHGLRTVVDGLLVGAGTVRAERYARLLRGAEDRRMRRRHGLTEELRTFIVSTSLDLSPQTAPLLAEPAAKVTILTPAAGALPQSAASVDYIRCGQAGRLDLAAALQRLRSERDVHTLLCEGGPHLASQLLAAGLVDELFLCIAPKLAGGQEHLRILSGAELDPPLALELLTLHEHESSLFLRYAVGG